MQEWLRGRPVVGSLAHNQNDVGSIPTPATRTAFNDIGGNAVKPKIMYFDIETSPVLAWIWRTGKQYITHNQIMKGMKSDIICICWKMEGEKTVHSLDWGINKQDSAQMVNKFVKILETTDIAIAHNGKKFDVKHINTQRLLHNQRPIAWPTIEDSLTQFRKYFYLPSFKLDYIAQTLAGGGKSDMVFQDWVDIVSNKKSSALDKMIKYCQKDVVLLEKVFKKAKAFFQPKVNASLILGNGRHGCPRCGTTKVQFYGYRRTLARSYHRLRCTACGTTYAGPSVK